VEGRKTGRARRNALDGAIALRIAVSACFASRSMIDKRPICKGVSLERLQNFGGAGDIVVIAATRFTERTD
jgi:hypothetical protein